MKKAYVVSKDIGERIKQLETFGYEISFWPNEVVPTPDQLLEQLQRLRPNLLIKVGTDDLNIRGDFLEALYQNGIRCIATRSTGLNLIDLEEVSRYGVPIVYAPEVPSVAEYTLGLMIAFLRRMPYALNVVKSGNWRKSALECSDEIGFTGKSLGVVGVGRIGKSLVVKTLGLGFQNILLHDIAPDETFERACRTAAAQLAELHNYVLAPGPKQRADLQYVDRQTLFENADIISLHVPLTTSAESAYPTQHYLSDAEFSAMRQQPLIINTARGGVIDTPALIRALEAGRIRGAVLDVVEDEPLQPGHAYYEGLVHRDNVMLSPHYCSRTFHNFDYMAEQLIQGLSYLETGEPANGRRCIANPEIL